jgi:hypothetical protein
MEFQRDSKVEVLEDMDVRDNGDNDLAVSLISDKVVFDSIGCTHNVSCIVLCQPTLVGYVIHCETGLAAPC